MADANAIDATNSARQQQQKKHEIVVKVRNAKNTLVEETVRFGFSENSKARRAYVGKLIMLGDSAVGKSQFVTATHCPFDEAFASIDLLPNVPQTTGVDFAVLNFEIGADTLYRLQLWDTAGQERFHSMLPMYARGASGIIIMYDVTNLSSFQSVEHRWQRFLDGQLQKRADDSYIPIMLVGNKIDAADQRVVSEQDARSFAFARGWNYRETTAILRSTVHTAIADMCVNMHYSALRAKCASEIIVTPDMRATRVPGTTPAPTTRLISKIFSEQSERKRKGSCCMQSS